MKWLAYFGIGILAYLVFLMVLFPASAVISRLPLDPVTVSGISGMLWNGEAATLDAPNEALPSGPDRFVVENIQWRLSPLQLLTGAAAADLGFEAYGGAGEGLVSVHLDQSVTVSDLVYVGNAVALSTLLDPFAKIAGSVELVVREFHVVDQVADRVDAELVWKQATLLEPVGTNLGTVTLTVKPDSDQHVAELRASGGDLQVQGSIQLARNGDFNTDITIQPQAGTPRVVTDMLRGLARPASDGSFRVRQRGNINRLM